MASNSFSFSLTPEFGNDVLKKVGLNLISINANYVLDESTKNLTVESDDVTVFDDVSGVWSVEEHGLNLEYEFKWTHPEILFADSSIIGPNDLLGIATRILSYDSRQRFILGRGIKTIDSSIREESFHYSIQIPPGKIRKNATIEIILYVQESEYEVIRPGSVLGIIYSDTLLFSGDGSIFPIETSSYDENFLWKLFIEYEDPRVDRFDQSVMLSLNEKHPRYKELKLDTEPMSNVAFREILAQAIFLIINKMKESEYFEDICSNNNLESGSIGEAVYYMIVNYGSNYKDPLTLSNDIHDMISSIPEALR